MKKITRLAVVVLIYLTIANISAQEIGITSSDNFNILDDSANSPSTTNHTDFSGSTSGTFTISNVKTGSPSTLNIDSIVLSNTENFYINSKLENTSLNKGNSSNFTIGLNDNYGCGVLSTDVIISSNATNDGTDNIWTFTISANISCSGIWDQLTSSSYKYDITGIGRDDNSGFNKKQSISSSSTALVTIGLGEIALNNDSNYNTFKTNKDFLIWGNNGAEFNTTTESRISISLNNTTTSFTPISRIWKIVETQNDVPDVIISLSTSNLIDNIPLSSSEKHVLVVLDDDSFTSDNIIDVIPFTKNGSNSEVWYDFDETKFFTIAKATGVYQKSHIDFSSGEFILGEDDIHLASTFTISTWVKNNGMGGIFLSKGTGYQFKINDSKQIEISWNNKNQVTSKTSIPDNEWHHIAITYCNNTASLYIDGILDTSVNYLTDPIPNNTHRLTVGAIYNDKNDITSFDGSIDELLIWHVYLDNEKLRYIMNQEIKNINGTVNGKILSSISTNTVIDNLWQDLDAYYNMNSFYGTTIEDGSNRNSWGRITYLEKSKAIAINQTTPLPFESKSDGDWNDSETWASGIDCYIPGSVSIVDNTVTLDWNIVKTSHNITMNNSNLPSNNMENRTLLGLIINTNELTIEGETSSGTGNGLTISHYLKIDGTLDLEGESQLIQNQNSELDANSKGFIERDQQGKKDLFVYNYWSSPVGVCNTSSNNNSFTLGSNILRNGTIASAPNNINFLTSGYNGGISGSNIRIADYWIWKYASRLGDPKSQWQHIRSTGTIYPGEGFTMKGVENTSGNVSIEQNYVFTGKPNNGDIKLTIAAGNDYLVGNPYASALDADAFIKDHLSVIDGGRNSDNIINGALYFWDHFARGTHSINNYVGGYGVYTLMGGVPALNNNDRIGATGEIDIKTPERYIPVGQGFLVQAQINSNTKAGTVVGGDIIFKNSQRVFQKELVTSSSLVSKTITASKTTNLVKSDDTREKIRLVFNSPNGYHRQILAGIDDKATKGYDLGYDASIIETNVEDMYWSLSDGEKLVIQALDNFNEDQTLPFVIKTESNGLSTILIKALENMDIGKNVFVYDKELNVYHNLIDSPYEVYLISGEHTDRFEIIFANTNASLDLDKTELNSINVFYNDKKKSIAIHNRNSANIQSIEIYNLLGQSICKYNETISENYHELNVQNLSSGTYIIKVKTIEGTLSKKVLAY